MVVDLGDPQNAKDSLASREDENKKAIKRLFSGSNRSQKSSDSDESINNEVTKKRINLKTHGVSKSEVYEIFLN